MKLTGVIHSLGGFHTIRGFAPLADLARISKPEEFQRELILEHKEGLRDFYRRRQDLFFPEVVLSYTLKYDFTKEGAESGVNPVRDIVVDRKEFKSNVDEIRVRPLQTEIGKQRVVEIIITDSWFADNTPFSRIDGNHRISAFLEENEHNPLDEFSAPFCIILFEDNTSSRNSKKVIFHNINSKARPLTTEEELKGIISNDDLTDDELKERIGWSFYQTRLLQNHFTEANLQALTNIRNAFNNSAGVVCINTVLHKLIVFLRANDLIESEQEDLNVLLLPVFEQVNIAFHQKPKLIETLNSAFLISAFGIVLNEELNVENYSQWLASNHLGELNEVSPQSLYDIYLKLKENRPSVFVAMPYFSQDEITSYNAAYQRVVDRLNDENPDLDLYLNPIMSHQGMTHDIVVNMISQINKCSIFIADISESNVNVGYELGWARSKDIPTIILKRNNDGVDAPFDYEHDVRKTYNPAAIQTLEDVVYTDVKAILVEMGYVFNNE